MGEPISPNSFLDTTRLHRWVNQSAQTHFLTRPGFIDGYLRVAPSALTLNTFTPRLGGTGTSPCQSTYLRLVSAPLGDLDEDSLPKDLAGPRLIPAQHSCAAGIGSFRLP